MSKATHEAGITKALEGETVQWKEGPGNRQVKYQVKAACEQKNNGRWYCITHAEGFANQLQKDSHISEHSEFGPGANHRLVWICFAHGPEVP